MKIEKVGWLDTHSEPNWAHRVELLNSVKALDLLCYTIGYVLAETGDRLILAATWSNNDMVGEVVVIPRRAIVSRSVLVEEEKGEGI